MNRKIKLSRSSPLPAPGYNQQVPESFTKSIREDQCFLFHKWVKISLFPDKKTLMRKTHYDDRFLVFHTSKKILLYTSDPSLNNESKLILQIDLSDHSVSSFRVIKDKNSKFLIRGKLFDGQNRLLKSPSKSPSSPSKKERTNNEIKIRCLNPFEFDNLYALLKRYKINEVKTEKIKEKEKKLRKDSKREIKLEKKIYRTECSVSSWSNEDVLNWSKNVLVGEQMKYNLFELYGEELKEREIDGIKILSLSAGEVDEFIKSLDTLKKFNFADKRKIRNSLNRMKDAGKYDFTMDIITKKVVNMLRFRSMKVSNVELMKLRKLFSQEKWIQKSLLSQMYKSNEDANRPKIFSVKVNIVENLFDAKHRRMRKVLGVLLNIKDTASGVTALGEKSKKKYEKKDKGISSTEFGVFHSSLSIGSLQIEWVDTELVVIREVCSEKAILSCDVAKMEIKNGHEFVKMLAKEIWKWNLFYSYTNYKASATKGNCQYFVQKILKGLKVNWRMPKGVKKFLKEMKYHATNEIVFRFDSKFANHFFSGPRDEELRKAKMFKPETHKDLDLFVQMLFKKNEYFDRDFNEEYELLKSFDRAFWLRFRNLVSKNQEHDDWMMEKVRPSPRTLQPSESNWRLNGCPFTRPHPGSLKNLNQKT